MGDEVLNHELYHGDCIEVMRGMEACSVDAVVTDPPYGLGFMGKAWDDLPPGREVFEECLRVLKPGGHLLAFGGSRTYHRLAVAVEDAGFEIRDQIMWIYGSGFPKSQDVSKAVDKATGAEREVVGPNKFAHLNGRQNATCYGAASRPEETAPATEAARQWEGWGTALKPAHEPIVMARKPLVGTVAQNVTKYGIGAVNVDECRIPGRERTDYGLAEATRTQNATYGEPTASADFDASKGRFPANVLHDGSDEVTESMGEAARYFYCAKADRADRDEGCESFAERPLHWSSGSQNPGSFQSDNTRKSARNNHPTVKPTNLMRWLCRLITPPGGIVLDPFMGSGSTGKAAALEGFGFVGVEAEESYLAIAQARINAATRQGQLFEGLV